MSFIKASEYDKKVRKSILDKLRNLYKNNKITINDLNKMAKNGRITIAESIFALMDDDGNFIEIEKDNI